MFKVMTLNLNYYGSKYGPWSARRSLIADLIASNDVDVVAFQAVRSEPAVEKGLDQARQLAELLPEYQYVVYQPAQREDLQVTQGFAFLSRIEVAETAYLELSLIPGLEDHNRRILLHVRLDLPQGALHILNAHVSWVGQQARENLREILSYANSISGPAMIVGDLNQTPDVDLWQQLAATGWIDTWSVVRPGAAGYTFEAGEPRLRIDYVWANHDLIPAAHSIEVTGQAQATGNVHISDHLALLASFDIQTGRG